MTPDEQTKDLTPDEAAASLAFATSLQDGVLEGMAEVNGTANPEASQGQETAPQETETKEPESTTEDKKEPQGSEDIEKLVDQKVEEKIGELRDQITNALDDSSEQS